MSLNNTIEDKPPEPKKISGHPPIHSELLEWKQALGVISIITMTTLIIMALLQIKFHKQCWPSFKKKQFSNISGKVLFILFIIGFVMFYVNSIVFTYFIFHLDTLSDNAYAHCLIFSMVPYRFGKLAMGTFFILRLHFVFKVSAFKINKWIIASLLTLLTIGTILGCIAATICGMYCSNDSDQKGVYPALALAISYGSLGITIFVDIVVMIYYVQRLMKVVIMRAEISRTSMRSPSAKKDSTQSSTEVVQFKEVAQFQTKVNVSEKMVRTITKSTLLSLIGILTSFWLHFQMMVSMVQNSTDAVLYKAIASFDGAINVICMYLIFAFAKNYYDFGCKWCDIGMVKCCTFITKKAVLKAKVSEHVNASKL